MGVFKFLGLALSLSTNSIASPLEKRIGQTFTVNQGASVPNTKPGPVALAQAYGKFKVQPPPEVKQAASKNDGSISAQPTAFDVEYLCPVTIGGQTLNLDFDTGSADLWVYSTELPKNLLFGHDYYNPNESKTEQKLAGSTWSIQYGDQSSAGGDVVLDTVQVGKTTATKQAVELAQEVSQAFQEDTNSDGLLGLAFDRLNMVQPNPQKTFFSNVKASLDAPLFTVDLKKGQPGSYDFGFIDDSKHTSSITYAPANAGQGYWGFTASGYSVGDNKSFISVPIQAIADTGTTLLLLPSTVVLNYYNQIHGAFFSSEQAGYIFPCTTPLLDLNIQIQGYQAVIPGSYINYAPLGGGMCYGGIQRSSGLGFAVFGDIFLKSQFVVFDASAPRLGFAPKNL